MTGIDHLCLLVSWIQKFFFTIPTRPQKPSSPSFYTECTTLADEHLLLRLRKQFSTDVTDRLQTWKFYRNRRTRHFTVVMPTVSVPSSLHL